MGDKKVGLFKTNSQIYINLSHYENIQNAF